MQIIHKVPGEYHWPQIHRGSCDNLFCRYPSSCIALKREKVTKCVHVVKKINGKWTYLGRQPRSYENHLACGCRSCSDNHSYQQCINTKPCRNSHTANSFCYWTPFLFTIKPPTIGPPTIGPPHLSLAEAAAAPEPIDDLIAPIPLPIHGICRCCTPVPCKLPKIFVNSTCRCECPTPKCKKGQTYNRDTCVCECPEGSTLGADGYCIGRYKHCIVMLSSLHC